MRNHSIDPDRLRDFLRDSLALWGVAGRIEAGEGAIVAIVCADDGAIVWVERPSDGDVPCRWLVRWRSAGESPDGPREQRPRPCASVVGLLAAMRGALGVDRGSALRIAQ